MNDLFTRVKSIPTPDVVRAFFPGLELKRDGGGREKALCPFHHENTASFTVFEDGWKCFGCGAHGSNVDLLLKASLASKPLEAAKMIAERFGIETGKEKKPGRQQVLTLPEYAAYVKLLQDSLAKTFHLEETPKGIAIPYRDENGKVVSVQIRHRLAKGKGKDARFSWREGKPYLYGAWAIPRWKEKETKQVLLCEGASDVQVCWFNQIPALGIPGASAFKPEWVSLLLPFPELAIIQEPGEAGEKFVRSICAALKEASYRGQIKAVILPEKDPRDLWLKCGERFKEELEAAIVRAPVINLASITTEGTKKKQSIPPEFENRIIHPALHIEPGFSSVGVITREGSKPLFQILTSLGGPYPAEHVKDSLTAKPVVHPGLSDRWRSVSNPPSLSESIALLIEKLRSLVWFEDKRWYPVIAVWSAGTYLFPAFPAYPYLQQTGEKGSGKTKLHDVLECTAFNALKVIDPTPAILFRLVHVLRPTLLIDEAEKMNSEKDKEVKGIINAGYKRGATVARCEGENHDLRFFEVYGPKCLAGIRGLGAVTEDRCITVVMSKPAPTDARQNKAVDPTDKTWASIRDGLYQLPFKYGDKVLAGFDEANLPAWLRARDRELWSPLLQLASIVDAESSLSVFDDLLGLAEESVHEKGLSFEADAILGLLESMLNGHDVLRIHPVDLVPGLEESLNRKGKVSPEWVGSRLRSLGFKKDEDISRDRRGVIYKVSAEKLSEIRCRLIPPRETYTPTHTKPTQPELNENKEEF